MFFALLSRLSRFFLRLPNFSHQFLCGFFFYSFHDLFNSLTYTYYVLISFIFFFGVTHTLLFFSTDDFSFTYAHACNRSVKYRM